MSARYNTREGMEKPAAAYALTALAQLAEGREWVETAEQAREWAQNALAQMVAEGYIEPRDEVQS